MAPGFEGAGLQRLCHERKRRLGVEPAARIPSHQPRSGGIAVSPGRKPWVKPGKGFRAAERRRGLRHSLFRPPANAA